MRCPDCNKFVSYGEMEIEIDTEIDGDTVTVSGTLILPCGNCGIQLKSLDVSDQIEITHDCQDGSAPLAPGADAYALDSAEGDPTERRQSTDAKGKPIPVRYQKTYYGADIRVVVKCNRCAELIELSAAIEDQTSSFEELT